MVLAGLKQEIKEVKIEIKHLEMQLEAASKRYNDFPTLRNYNLQITIDNELQQFIAYYNKLQNKLNQLSLVN